MIILTLLISLYFLFLHRRIDIWFVFFFSFVFYFSPVFYGFTIDPTRFDERGYIPLDDYVLIFFSISIFSIFFLSVCAKFGIYGKLSSRFFSGVSFEDQSVLYAYKLLSFFVLLLTIYFIYQYYDVLVSSQGSKRDFYDYQGFLYYLWMWSVIIGVGLSAYYRSYFLLVFLFALLVDLYSGQRTHFVFSFIVYFTIWFRSVFFKGYFFSFLVAPVLLFFFVAMVNFKSLYANILRGEYNRIFDLFSLESFSSNFVKSEPFTILGILNAVATDDFRSNNNVEDFFLILKSGIPFGRTLFGGDGVRFREEAHSFYAAHRETWGMAHNFFAEGYWLFGQLGPYFYLSIILLLVYFVSVLMNRFSFKYYPFFAPLIPILAFYFHRNDLIFIFTQLRYFLISLLLFYLFVVFVRVFFCRANKLVRQA
ncbi:MAG: hypothetical protein LAT65_18820 [Saccharospirillum sp.]|nr:hypothetical protein [Saccharospirillum sp.]